MFLFNDRTQEWKWRRGKRGEKAKFSQVGHNRNIWDLWSPASSFPLPLCSLFQCCPSHSTALPHCPSHSLSTQPLSKLDAPSVWCSICPALLIVWCSLSTILPTVQRFLSTGPPSVVLPLHCSPHSAALSEHASFYSAALPQYCPSHNVAFPQYGPSTVQHSHCITLPIATNSNS